MFDSLSINYLLESLSLLAVLVFGGKIFMELEQMATLLLCCLFEEMKVDHIHWGLDHSAK